ncbi:replication protein A 32 kDa subunit A isoform X2 [Mangifera indica]|uniref:replication protein A 32 kDa subunit A isoform X2 n=1 Tax=Mangifera indica TaxID=29780 RepID=UPI001CFC3E12|nr:replication protein A 32 kDa subunit A isoform X2 [Mangifera indica]
MFSSSQFDANSAFSGGGFMPHQSQPADSNPSPARSRDSLGLVPLTVKLISEASQSGDEKSNFVVNGSEVTNVTLVGMVFGKEERASDVTFTLDDGTGRVLCKRWASEVFDTKEMEAVQDGMYVRLNGHLKSFQGKKQLVAFSVRPVTSFDEVTFHFIDCIYFQSQKSKLQVQGSSIHQPQLVDSSLHTPVQTGSNNYQTAPSNHLSSQFGIDGLKDCDQLILDYLQQPSSRFVMHQNFVLLERERGVHIDELSQQLKIPKKKIMDSIASLENEGLIYSTIDEFHYKFARG